MKIISKGMWLLAAVGLLAVSCAKEQAVAPDAQMVGMPSITAVAAGNPATKVAVSEGDGNTRPIVWEKGDALSVFYRSAANLKFQLDGEGGESVGVFSYASGNGGGLEFPQVFAAYPYDNGVSMEDGCLWVAIPPEQNYTAGTFDPKANVMVGVSDPGANMAFKNLGGYMVLQFYGEDVEVSSITVEGAMGEQIAGPVLVGIEEDELPWIEEWGAASETVTLVAKEPVKVGATADEATEFWLVMMPGTFMDGFTVTVECSDGTTFTQTLSDSFEVSRSAVSRMAPLDLTPFDPTAPIVFKDADLKAHLIEKGVDTNEDGEISYEEAAAVTSFNGIFEVPATFSEDEAYVSPYTFTSFDELAYFTGVTLSVGQFYKWAQLKSVTVPGTVTSLPNYAFANCTALSSVKLNKGLESIGVSCFAYCSSLESISIPEGVKALNPQCFMYSGIKSLTFPTTITTVYGGICSNCPQLESLVVRGINTIPGGAFGGMPALKSVTIDGVKELGGGSFYSCPLVTSVTLNEGLEKIQNGSFSFAGLPSLVVPASVTYLGTGSFSGCGSLTSITLLATTPSEDYHYNFIDALPNSNCKVYVPAASLDAYMAHFHNSEGRVFPIE